MVCWRKILVRYSVVLGLVAAIGLWGSTGVSRAEMSELETFIRIRIEIGESMAAYMRERSGTDRTMENYSRMTEEINMMVEAIMEPYGLQSEEYQERSPQVFSDEAAVSAFLEAHPDLKKQYEGLSLHQPGRGSF